MCLDARLLQQKLVNMNMNQNYKVFQNPELNFHREKEHVWGSHVSDTIFFVFNSTHFKFLYIGLFSIHDILNH